MVNIHLECYIYSIALMDKFRKFTHSETDTVYCLIIFHYAKS